MKSIHQPEYRRLLASLIQARKDAAVTQQTLARQLGKPQSFVSKYEKGERRLDAIELVKIAECIGADYKHLIDDAMKAGSGRK